MDPSLECPRCGRAVPRAECEEHASRCWPAIELVDTLPAGMCGCRYVALHRRATCQHHAEVLAVRFACAEHRDPPREETDAARAAARLGPGDVPALLRSLRPATLLRIRMEIETQVECQARRARLVYLVNAALAEVTPEHPSRTGVPGPPRGAGLRVYTEDTNGRGQRQDQPGVCHPPAGA